MNTTTITNDTQAQHRFRWCAYCYIFRLVHSSIHHARKMKPTRALLSSVLLLCACARAAQPAPEPAPDEEPVAEVAINAIKNPELKPYRVMSAGLDAFDEYRALAPNATLQFQLSRRGEVNWFKGSWEGVTLRLAGSDTSIPIPIGKDGRFTLPRSKEAYDDDAELILNQKKSLVRFSVDVRTPGLPANARRLGDLRLQCKVQMGIGKKELNFATRAAFNAIFLGSDWCASRNAKFGFALPDWSMGTSVVHGAKRIPINAYGYHIVAPLTDKSLPDDALVEFEFWTDASLERKKEFLALRPLSLNSSVNKWGPGQALQLKDNGNYSALMQLKPGRWKFRLGSKGGESSLGASGGKEHAALGIEQALAWHGEDLKLEVDQAGTYEFAFNLHDLDRPVGMIKRVDAVAAAQ